MPVAVVFLPIVGRQLIRLRYGMGQAAHRANVDCEFFPTPWVAHRGEVPPQGPLARAAGRSQHGSRHSIHHSVTHPQPGSYLDNHAGP